MNSTILLISIILLAFLGVLLNKQKPRLYKKSYKINDWMIMTKKQRLKVDEEDKLNTLMRKKRLISTIRQEYNNYRKSKGNSL